MDCKAETNRKHRAKAYRPAKSTAREKHWAEYRLADKEAKREAGKSDRHHFRKFVAQLLQEQTPYAAKTIGIILSVRRRNKLRNACSTGSHPPAKFTIHIGTDTSSQSPQRTVAKAPFSPPLSIRRRIKRAIMTYAKGKTTGEDGIFIESL